MIFFVFFAIYPFFASCTKETELKVEYLEKLINSAFEQTKTYKTREDNSDFFRNVSQQDVIHDYGTFDFIVVGGGSSGSVVASRLSEVEKWKVLLLEAGDWDDDLTDIPYIYSILQFSDRNWGYYTVPQKNGCFGWKNNKFHYVRGKVLGGTGTMNGLAYARGNKQDYDNWADLGNLGWSFDDILKYFKKLENFESHNIDLNYRGFAGPLNVAYAKPEQEIFQGEGLFVSEIGEKMIGDYNAADMMGVSRIQRNIKHGKRVSGSSAYVKPSMSRHNFNLTLNAFVTKISIDEDSKTANGVSFVRNGKKYKAEARREVIISGGAVNSPQLLMLSGVGPKNELNKHNIKLISELPVGRYLKDHNVFKVYYRTNHTETTKSFKVLLKEYIRGQGMLTNLQSGLSYLYFNTSNESSLYPNVEMFSVASTPVPKPIPAVSNYIKEVEKYLQSINEQTDFNFQLYLLHPKSTGSLHLRSNSPIDFPIIDTGIFSDESDIEVLFEAVQFLNQIEDTDSARRLNASKLEIPFCDEHRFNSREYWYCAIRYLAYPSFHMSSTTKMGPETDPLAVVNHELKVFGINNLRVADCSIMPTPISGHNNAAAFVIGEKAADMIKKTYKNDICGKY